MDPLDPGGRIIRSQHARDRESRQNIQKETRAGSLSARKLIQRGNETEKSGENILRWMKLRGEGGKQ